MNIEYTKAEQIEQMREELRLARQKEQARQSNRFLHLLEISGKVVGHVLFYIIVVFLLAVLVSILVTKSKGKIPSVLGYQMYVVESGSMEPTLKVGAVILSRAPENKDQLAAGTIITFHTADGSTVVTHRIVEVVKDENGGVWYRTKGDNPINSPDKDLVSPDKILAVFVLKVPFT